MLGRIVHIDTGYQTVSAVQDLIEAKLGSGQAGYVIGWKIFQSSIETTTSLPKYKVALKRAAGAFTSGSGGGSATATKGQSGDAAHGLATTERNNTTQASGGTIEEVDGDILNEASGAIDVKYIPEEWRPIGPSEAAILSIDEAPASQTMRAILTLLITHG